MEYIKAIENSLNIKAKIEFLPMQKGDVKETFADTSALESWIKYKPSTNIKDGILFCPACASITQLRTRIPERAVINPTASTF